MAYLDTGLRPWSEIKVNQSLTDTIVDLPDYTIGILGPRLGRLFPDVDKVPYVEMLAFLPITVVDDQELNPLFDIHAVKRGASMYGAMVFENGKAISSNMIGITSGGTSITHIKDGNHGYYFSAKSVGKMSQQEIDEQGPDIGKITLVGIPIKDKPKVLKPGINLGEYGDLLRKIRENQITTDTSDPYGFGGMMKGRDSFPTRDFNIPGINPKGRSSSPYTQVGTSASEKNQVTI